MDLFIADTGIRGQIMSKLNSSNKFFWSLMVCTLVGVPLGQVSAGSEGITFSVSGDCWDKSERKINLRQNETQSCKISYAISSKLKNRDVALLYYYVDYPEDGWELDSAGKSNKSGKGSFRLNSWFDFVEDCYDESFGLNFVIVVAQSGKNKRLTSKIIPAYKYGSEDFCY